MAQIPSQGLLTGNLRSLARSLVQLKKNNLSFWMQELVQSPLLSSIPKFQFSESSLSAGGHNFLPPVYQGQLNLILLCRDTHLVLQLAAISSPCDLLCYYNNFALLITLIIILIINIQTKKYSSKNFLTTKQLSLVHLLVAWYDQAYCPHFTLTSSPGCIRKCCKAL